MKREWLNARQQALCRYLCGNRYVREPAANERTPNMRSLTMIATLIAALALPAGAAEIISQGTARTGVPEPARVQSHSEIDPAEMAQPQSPKRDVILSVEMEKYVYEKGEAPTLRAKLHKRDGTLIDDAKITVVLDANSTAGDPKPRQEQTPMRKSGDHYETTLPGTPGDHEVEVYADAVMGGTSVHRSATMTYGVGTGAVTVLGRGEPVSDGERLIVPLNVRVNVWGVYQIDATLAANGKRIAATMVTVRAAAGDDTVPLTFNRADLVEPGPYRLRTVQVIHSGPGPDGVAGVAMATAPGEVGTPFEVR